MKNTKVYGFKRGLAIRYSKKKKTYAKNVDSGNAIGDILVLREVKLETSPSF